MDEHQVGREGAGCSRSASEDLQAESGKGDMKASIFLRWQVPYASFMYSYFLFNLLELILLHCLIPRNYSLTASCLHPLYDLS